MLKIQYYNWGELEDLLSVQFTKSNGRAKLISRNIAPFYEYRIVKEGRKTIGLNIIGFKGEQKVNSFSYVKKLLGLKLVFQTKRLLKNCSIY